MELPTGTLLFNTLKSLRISGGFISPSPRTRFQISGADRTRYLNSQLSNDLRKIVKGMALPACLLTPKGKMCALVWAFEQKDNWIIDADSKICTALRNRLERYIIADDVQVEDISDTGILFHVFGEAASAITLSEKIHASRIGFAGIDIWISNDQIDAFYKKLLHLGIFEATPHLSEPLRIAQGIPAWGSDISEETLPAEAGLDRFAVDFAKGCYVGQEIVSRIRSVGRVNRHLAGFVAESPEAVLSPSLKIIDPTSKASVGTLTSTAFHFELSRAVAMGYLKTGITSEILLAVHPKSGEETPLRVHEFPLSVSS